MKKLLTLAVAVAAIASQAASIDWAINTGAKTMKDSTGEKMAGTAYIILASDVSNIESSLTATIDGFTSAMSKYALGNTGISSGKANPNSGTATSSKLTAGTSYTYAVLVFDSVNKEYYVSGTMSQYAYDSTSPDAALQVPKAISFGATEMGATSGTTASSQTFKSAISVPEPATGALALAGLALLFRRRRA